MRKHSRFFFVVLLALLIALFCACDDSDDSDESNDNAAFISAFSGIGITFSESDLSGIDVLLTANDPAVAIYSKLTGSISSDVFTSLENKMLGSTALSGVPTEAEDPDNPNVTSWSNDGHYYQIQIVTGENPYININYTN